MARREGYDPAPGQRNPEKYPIVGANYNKYGEQQGYVYNPWTDLYDPDPRAQQQYYESAGLIEPEKKPPGMLETLAPLAAGAGALGVAQGFAKDPKGFISGIGGLFGGAESPIAEAAAVQAAAPTAGASTGLLGGASAPVATSAATGAPATAAELGATQAAPGGLLSGLPSLGTVAPLAGVAGGIALGARGIRDMYKGEPESYANVAKNPIGVGGRATLAIATGGLSELGRAVGLFGNKKQFKTEQRKLEGLQSQGVYVPQSLIDNSPQKGRSKDELIRRDLDPDFVGRDTNGNWVNNKFAQSRDVADLRPTDIVNYSAFAEKDPDWFKKSVEEREKIAAEALAAGAVSEGKGSIKIDWKKLEKPKEEAIE